MTQKLKMLGRIKNTRKRVRDASAAAVATAETARVQAEGQMEDSSEALDELYRDASTRFVGTVTVRQLWQYDLERHGAIADLRVAELRALEATRRAELTRKELAEKERELRKTEKAIERQKAEEHMKDRRAEQKTSDDANGRRK
jgi:Flagellar FliJ protein